MSITFIAQSELPTPFGIFTIYGFLDKKNNKEHIALGMGDFKNSQEPVLARVHSECLTGDALFSMRCDCGAQLALAMKKIAEEKKGVILYLKQEGRGIGLVNKIRAYHLQDEGFDTVEANEKLGFQADQRQYDMCKAMLDHLDIRSIRLMTNNPKKIKALESVGIHVVREPHLIEGNLHNEKYLQTKIWKLGHISKSK